MNFPSPLPSLNFGVSVSSIRSFRPARGFSCLLLALACAAGGVTLRAQDAKSAAAGASTSGTYARDPATIAKGKKLFVQQCTACHSLAQEGFGPPLGGVTTLFTESELLERIRDAGKVIAAGDPRENALLRRYKMPMPLYTHLAHEDLVAIAAYLNQQSTDQQLKPLVVDVAAPPPPGPRLLAPVQKTALTIELEDFVQIPRLPGRTAYKGITLVRPDPREDGALLIDDLMGIIYRVTKARQVSVFLDVRGIFREFVCDPGVATGLGSFALHPDFVHNGIFYTTHAENFRHSPTINARDIPADVPKWETPPLEWVLTEWHLADPKATTFAGTHREVIRFATPTTGHAWQEIAFAPVSDRSDPDYGMLYIGCGDGGSTNLKRPDMSGHVRTLLGAILRIDPAGRNGTNGQYGIPADNPFAGSSDPTIYKEIWAYGFRNPHRISWDLAHPKRMISVDIGESNVEEVNLIEKGGAYGYGVRQLEGTLHIDPKIDAKVARTAVPTEQIGTLLPFGEYDHVDGYSITGGYVYHGPLEALRDKYIFGDMVNGHVFYMNMGADLTDHVIYEINIVRHGVITGIKELSHVDRAHLRVGYDERTGDLFVTTKEDGMVRRVTAAYLR